jgi:LuxR family transcriptional regulator, maltose regulon positive regulatory protein
MSMDPEDVPGRSGAAVAEVSERPGREHGTGRSAIDLLAAKLLHPQVRPETVRRAPLIERLARDEARPIVSVVAPAGYGKTTLLSQWAERNGQAFAWVSVDEGDNDPKVLLTYVAEALNAVEPLGQRVFDALASPVSSVPGSVVPRLGSAFSSMAAPVALVLDDVHLLHNFECRAALSVLADHVPGRSRLVLAGRAKPPVRVGRLRAEGKILEIGPGELSLTRDEASALLRAASVVLSDDDVAELHRRTEGWPAGLYLAALYLREGGSVPGAAASFGGDDLFVSEYVESEFLAQISPGNRLFLTRTAVLERMSGPLCAAVLEWPGAGAVLADLARSNLLVVPLDHRGQWYRYHHLFRDMLLADLERQEPGLIPVLRRRAAAWCLGNGMPEASLEYSMAAGDVEEAASLVEKLWPLMFRQNPRIATLQRWCQWLDDHGGMAGHPVAAVGAALLAEATGRPVEAERWADAVDRWQHQDANPSADLHAQAMAAGLRAVLCRHGVEQMRADADEAARGFAAVNFVAPLVTLMQGIARVLCGDLDGGDAFFADTISARESAAADVLTSALCERSLVAIAHGRWDQAEAWSGEAAAVLRRAGTEDSNQTPLVSAVQARVAVHRGDVAAARRELVSAQRLRHLLTYALPHIAVQARIELALVHIALADFAGARTLMHEVDELLKRRPDLGTLVGEAQALRDRLSAERGSQVVGASALTSAELRVLPLLATHMRVSEIAAELFLSPHTIRAQLKSLYRKLGASSRSEAVTRSRELGLLDT